MATFVKSVVALLVIVQIVHRVESCSWNVETPLTETGLPTVDLRDSQASSKLARALQDWGFSYITGHSVPEDVVEEASEQSKSFFDLPIRVKRDLAANRDDFTKTARGYTGLKLERLDIKGKPDLKEVLDIGHVNKKINEQQKIKNKHYLGENKWLNKRDKRDAGSGLQNATETYSEHASMLAQNILSLTAKGLGCEDAFKPVFGPNALQIQRLTRYPPTQEIEGREPGQIGAGVHSDYGGITVLYAEGPGLSVLKPNRTSKMVDTGTFSPELEVPNSGEWVDVDSIQGAFIVMAGEALQRLSNGQIYAAKHKVDYIGSLPRHSMAFFYDPHPEAVLEPLDCFKKSGKSLYKAKVSGHKGVIRKVVTL